MTTTLIGVFDWKATRSKKGHRTYKTRSYVESDDVLDGPRTVMQTTGLPTIGSTFGIGNDTDSWAFCTPQISVTPLATKERNYFWIVENTFTTDPYDRDQSDERDDPTSEPYEISGSFSTFQREAVKDKNGKLILSSSAERLEGSLLEFDDANPTIKIAKNFASLPLGTYAPMIHTVNDAPMWGLSSARMVKLANATFQRHVYDVNTFYYNVTYDFEVDFGTFDREVADIGTRVLKPGANPGSLDPADYEPHSKPGKVLLNGSGRALTDVSNPTMILIQLYDESDFTTLDIPTSF